MDSNGKSSELGDLRALSDLSVQLLLSLFTWIVVSQEVQREKGIKSVLEVNRASVDALLGRSVNVRT